MQYKIFNFIGNIHNRTKFITCHFASMSISPCLNFVASSRVNDILKSAEESQLQIFFNALNTWQLGGQ